MPRGCHCDCRGELRSKLLSEHTRRSRLVLVAWILPVAGRCPIPGSAKRMGRRAGHCRERTSETARGRPPPPPPPPGRGARPGTRPESPTSCIAGTKLWSLGAWPSPPRALEPAPLAVRPHLPADAAAGGCHARWQWPRPLQAQLRKATDRLDAEPCAAHGTVRHWQVFALRVVGSVSLPSRHL